MIRLKKMSIKSHLCISPPIIVQDIMGRLKTDYNIKIGHNFLIENNRRASLKYYIRIILGFNFYCQEHRDFTCKVI